MWCPPHTHPLRWVVLLMMELTSPRTIHTSTHLYPPSRDIWLCADALRLVVNTRRSEDCCCCRCSYSGWSSIHSSNRGCCCFCWCCFWGWWRLGSVVGGGTNQSTSNAHPPTHIYPTSHHTRFFADAHRSTVNTFLRPLLLEHSKHRRTANNAVA